MRCGGALPSPGGVGGVIECPLVPVQRYRLAWCASASPRSTHRRGVTHRGRQALPRDADTAMHCRAGPFTQPSGRHRGERRVPTARAPVPTAADVSSTTSGSAPRYGGYVDFDPCDENSSAGGFLQAECQFGPDRRLRERYPLKVREHARNAGQNGCGGRNCRIGRGGCDRSDVRNGPRGRPARLPRTSPSFLRPG